MKKTRLSPPRMAGTLLCCLAAGSAAAAVIMRLPGGNAAAARIESLGTAHSAAYRMRVNGEDADVRVYGFDRPHAFLRPQLLRAFGADPGRSGNRRSTMLRFERDGRRGLLMLPRLNPDRTTVILAEFALLPPVPPRPEYPGANWPRAPSETLRFSALNRESGMALTVSDSPAGVETVRSEITRQLAADGWDPAAQALSALPSGGLYRRGGSICYILVNPSDRGGIRLTVLRGENPVPTP